MKKATKLIVGIALLAIGYVGGAYLGFPSSDKDQMLGDISKANKTEDPDMLAMRELLADDAETQELSIVSTAFLSSRIDVLDSLVEAGVKATEGQKELERICKYFTFLQNKTAKAKDCLTQLMEMNEKVIKGEKVDNFEEVSNNALLSFIVLDNAISNDAVGDMLDFTREIDNQKAADALTNWMVFCSQNAEDAGNAKDIAMWKNVYSSLSKSQKEKFDDSKANLNNDLAQNYADKLSESEANLKNVKLVGKKMPKVEEGGDLINAMISASCNQGLVASK